MEAPLVAITSYWQVSFTIINWFLKGVRCQGKTVLILIAFDFSKVYPRLTVILKPVLLSCVKCVNCWLHVGVKSKAPGRICAVVAASVTTADRVPKILWQVHSSIQSSSQTFNSLGHKIAVLPFDDKNQFKHHMAQKDLCILVSFINFLPMLFFLLNHILQQSERKRWWKL